MPKDSSKEPTSSYSSSSRSSSAKNTGILPVLKRNQACHQCRKRKLKCDAQRPCSACVRSHTHAVAHAPSGTQLPPHPECTYDDVSEASVVVAEGPKSRYERLENKINELEALLYQKERTVQTIGVSSLPVIEPESQPRLITSIPSGLVRAESYNLNGAPDFWSPQDTYPQDYSVNFDALSTPSSSDGTMYPFEGHSPSLTTSTVNTSADQTSSYISEVHIPINGGATIPPPQPDLDIIWSNWPPNLPRLDLLRHLVELFFAFHPHASRLFHAPSFLASLSLPPTHPKFPIPPVLHAICAISTMYTAAVTAPPLPNYGEVPLNEIFQQKYRANDIRPDSFAEEQTRFARSTIDKYLYRGEHLVEVLQANVILTWHYWSQANWVEVFIASGHSMRMLVPIGLNMCPPFHSISPSLRGAAILVPARTVIEDETRRNVFWLAYATDRTSSLSHGWAHALGDEDIAQLLPVRGDQFDRGILVSPQERQWSQSKNVCLNHPEEQIDAFTLYIKGASLISRVRNFNHRFRSKHFAGDAAYNADPSFSEGIGPRATQAFKDLDNVVMSFRTSFPPHLKNPITDNIVNPHLYCASLFPHVCTILLHGPHADVCRSGCLSALKILTAARATLELIYAVWSTSYDITLLDLSCTFCWLMSGRVLVRFLKAAQEANSQHQISTLRDEIQFIQLAISKVAERIPLSYMHAKLLHAEVLSECGASYGTTSPDSQSPPASLQTPNLNGPQAFESTSASTMAQQNISW